MSELIASEHVALAQPEVTTARPVETRLARVLGPGAAVLLTLSCITPASSLFIIVPSLLASQGSGVVLTLLAGVVQPAVRPAHASASIHVGFLPPGS